MLRSLINKVWLVYRPFNNALSKAEFINSSKLNRKMTKYGEVEMMFDALLNAHVTECPTTRGARESACKPLQGTITVSATLATRD
jgi:hypothetical protein